MGGVGQFRAEGADGEMAGTALLSPGDVSVIRRYVRTKYAPMPETSQAEIVADAISRTIRKRLPDWPDPLKSRVADKLIASCVVAEGREVYALDVLRYCGDLELADESQAVSLMRWLNERTPDDWTLDQIVVRTDQGLALRSDAPGASWDASNRRSRSHMMGIHDASSLQHEAPQAVMPSSDSFIGLEAPARPVPADATETLVSEASVASHASERAVDANDRRSVRLSPAALRWTVLAAMLLLALTAVLTQALPKTADVPNVPLMDRQGSPAGAADIDANAGQPFAFQAFDAGAVKAYLQGRDSLLAEEPYFTAIVESGRTHGIDPLLLFAVAGQEQGFVPKSAKKAKQIANNPFNVFHSWQDYNTNIGDSSGIAARLLAKLTSRIPEGEEPFAWMNRTYAEDPNWADGVRAIYSKLIDLGELKEEKP